MVDELCYYYIVVDVELVFDRSFEFAKGLQVHIVIIQSIVLVHDMRSTSIGVAISILMFDTENKYTDWLV